MKKKIIFFTLIILIFISYFYINKSIGNKDNFLQKFKHYIPQATKDFLKENIFFYKYKENLKHKVRNMDILLAEQKKKQAVKEMQLENLLILHGSIPIKKIDKIQKFQIENKNYSLKKFKTNFLYVGKNTSATGSSYLDYFDNKLFIASATGIFGYIDINKFNSNKFDILIIPSNIKDLIKYNDFYSSSEFGIKDLLIYKNKIYISYSNQIKKDCFNTSILLSDLNLKELKFEEFFTPDLCIDKNNAYGEFMGNQAGGRMFSFKDNKILFTYGEYRFRDHAQDKNNLFGKIISIDIDTKKFEIISMGHRNPQGLYYDVDENTIFSTEHGPLGGDEININISPGGEIENYGWPISSYGELYSLRKYRDDNSKYKNPTLYKSHKDYGFIEPIKYFSPSIAISEITKIPFEYNKIKKKQFFIGAMGNNINNGSLSIHHLILSNDNTILKHNIIPLKERVRDMIYIKEVNQIFLFLETSSSIGVLESKN